MRHGLHTAALLLVSCVAPTVARAGWVSDWTNTAVLKNGQKADPQPSAMTMANGRVRLEQPDAVTIIDYGSGRFTLMNPHTKAFWTGTIDEYVHDVTMNRASVLRSEIGSIAGPNKRAKKAMDGANYTAPEVDPAKLPPVSITKTGITDRIAGYDTVKYEARANGELFQEFWVAPSLDVSGDLDPNRFFAVQQKLSTATAGKSAEQYKALYRDEDYRALLAKAFVLKIVNHHIGGEFNRTATSIRQAEVPDSTFQVPPTYRKVRLADVLPAPTPNSGG
jgi:hypothetical protein